MDISRYLRQIFLRSLGVPTSLELPKWTPKNDFLEEKFYNLF